MKKILLLTLFTTFTLMVSAQIKGVNLESAKKVITDNDIKDETLLVIDGANGKFYSYSFSQSIIGYKHAIEKIKIICSENELSFTHANLLDNVFLPSYVKDIYDYSNVHLSVSIEEGEIKKIWELDNHWDIALIIVKDGYAIMFWEDKTK